MNDERHRWTAICCGALLACLLAVTAALAANAPKVNSAAAKSAGAIPIAELHRDKPVDFETEVLPILRRNCLACHNSSKSENHLVLETPQSILKGGENGPAVLPKQSAASRLLKLASRRDDPPMPPSDNNVGAVPLKPEELGLIKLWIDQGAGGQVTASAAPLNWQRLPPAVNPIIAVAVSSDGKYAACGRGNQIFLYQVESGALLGRLVDPALVDPSSGPGISHRDLVESLAFHPSGDLLASGSFREVKLWRRPRNVRLADLSGSTEAVRVVAVSPDGKRAATGEAGGAVRIWDLAAGKMLNTLAGHTAAVTGLRFSADGARLISGSLDKTVRVWNAADGSPAGQWTTPAPIQALTLAVGGSRIVTGHADSVIRVWAVPVVPASGAAPATAAAVALIELKGHGGAVTSLDTFAANDREILSGGEDGTVRKWNLDSKQQVQFFTQGAPVTAVAVRGDGRRFATAGTNNVIKLWNTETGQVVVELKGDQRSPIEVARLTRAATVARQVAADQRKLLDKAQARLKKRTDALAKVRDAKTAAEKTFAEKNGIVQNLTATKTTADESFQRADAAYKQLLKIANAAHAAAVKEPNSKQLDKADREAHAPLADAEQKMKEAKRFAAEAAKPIPAAQVEATKAEKALAAIKGVEPAEAELKKAVAALSPLQSAIDGADAAVRVAETALAAGQKSASDREKPFRSLAFSPDNATLAAGGDARLVETWSADTGIPLEVCEGHADAILALAFTSGGGLLAGAADKSLIVWNTQPVWRWERTIGGPGDPARFIDRVLALDFSPDGQLLATGGGEPSRSGELKLWNPADGTLVRAIPDAHSDTIYSVRFSPDGNLLASSAADRFVKVFQASDGTLVKSFEGHTGQVLGVAWRADGKWLASCGADNVIKVWDLTAGEQHRTIDGFSKEVTSLAFVGESPLTVATSGDHNVHVHNADNGSNARNIAGANDFLYSLAVTPDGKTVIAGGQDSTLRFWNIDTGQPIRQIAPPR